MHLLLGVSLLSLHHLCICIPGVSCIPDSCINDSAADCILICYQPELDSAELDSQSQIKFKSQITVVVLCS